VNKLKINKMKNLTKLGIAVVMAGFLASCSISGPLMVTNHSVGEKRGEASRKIFLNITFGQTDLGAITAAKNGGISKIATVDWKVTGGLFTTTYATIVTGE
jgi:hypothetical protein